MKTVGQPVNRQDGRLKITGAAKYSAEWSLPNMTHAVPVQSAIARGTIRGFDLDAAKKADGVLLILTHENRPAMGKPGDASAVGGLIGENVVPLTDNVIHYSGQNIALVVAETYEQARYAATLVKATYDALPPDVEMEKLRGSAMEPEKFFGTEEAQIVRGTPESALAGAAQKVSARYITPHGHHHPIEPHATIATWDGDKLTMYDASQGVGLPQRLAAGVFNVPVENVRVVCHFTGGGFGTKGSTWPHTFLAAMASRMIKRPVKLPLMRQHMTSATGHRPATHQDVAMGADATGKIAALQFDTLTDSSTLTTFFEPAGLTSRLLYAVDNYGMKHKVANVNLGAPIYMRAPGEAPGTFGMDSVMDEMAHALKMDPVAFRVANHADIDPNLKKPWSSKHLKACYERGAEMIGWNKRKMEPGGLREGRYLVGYGMATATYPANRMACGARVRVYPDGRVTVSAASNDIGTGTYTVLQQVTAEAFGVPLHRVRAELGDTTMPSAPIAGGSWLTASLAPAAVEAAEQAMAELTTLAVADKKSPLSGRDAKEIAWKDGRAFVKANPDKGETMAAMVKRSGKPYFETCVRAQTMMDAKDNQGLKQTQRPPCGAVMPKPEQDRDMDKYSFHSFGAQFCRVRVDPELGTVRLTHFVSVMDVGTILNPKTARNQIMGGIGFGIGMALSEETAYDPRNGRPVARNLADYHVAAHADVPDIQVEFLNIPDPHLNRLGARGVGEIGTTGVAAAIANAIFNATGKRLRELPLTPDKVIG